MSAILAPEMAGERTLQPRVFAATDGFRENFDRKPFCVSHKLQPDHPLFTLSRLRKLAAFLIENKCPLYWDAGRVSIGQRWGEVPRSKWTFEAAFDHIDQSGAWIVLKQVERDPEYAEILRQFIGELSEATGRNIFREQKQMDAIIFLTAPNRISSYHIDRECNFLLQISGEKQISIFDREDRDVLPESEIETFWAVDNNAAKYKEQYENRAMRVALRPGNGVHIPVNCPHWLKNGNNVSISLSVSYQFKDSKRKLIYQSNYYLRRFGMTPTPPGHNVMVDRAKAIGMGALVTARHVLRRDRA